MSTKMMIDNRTEYPMNDIYEYLAGFTTRLNDKITITYMAGVYYDNVYVTSC